MPVSSEATISPSIMVSSGSFERAFAIDGNRAEKSFPLRDMSRTRPPLLIQALDIRRTFDLVFPIRSFGQLCYGQALHRLDDAGRVFERRFGSSWVPQPV